MSPSKSRAAAIKAKGGLKGGLKQAGEKVKDVFKK
jgi:hypothetical protein